MAVASISVRDARAAPADRLWIQSVYRDYLDDLNPDTGLFPALGEIGHREPDQIAHWFADPNTFPLVIAKGHEPVGFARVVRTVASAAPPRIDYRMAEFFVARAKRRRGIGQTAVQLIRGTLGDHRVPAQHPGGELLAPRGQQLHPRQLSGTDRQRRGTPGV
jgi:predicted acetyltransferase